MKLKLIILTLLTLNFATYFLNYCGGNSSKAAGAAELQKRKTIFNNNLINAVKKGDANLVTDLLAQGFNFNAIDILGNTPLIVAAKKGHTSIVNILLANGALTNAINRYGYTALMVAAKKGHIEIVNLLLERDTIVDLIGRGKKTALVFAAKNGHLEIVNALLKKGATANIRFQGKRNNENYDRSLLVMVVKKGHTEIVNSLISYDANVRGCDIIRYSVDGYYRYKDDYEAIVFAIQYGYTEIVKSLLNKNELACYCSIDGITGLMFASLLGHAETVSALIEKNEYINQTRPDYQYNARNYINAVDKNGNTALIFAANKGYTDIVNILLAAGANVNAANKSGNTAFTVAKQKGHTDTADALRKAIRDKEILRGTDPKFIPLQTQDHASAPGIEITQYPIACEVKMMQKAEPIYVSPWLDSANE